jgi:hypothetical protein
MPEATAAEPATRSDRSAEIRRIALATYFGTALEWYDYFIYGTAAALVFPALFFPALDPIVGVIASLVAFALGFVARPGCATAASPCPSAWPTSWPDSDRWRAPGRWARPAGSRVARRCCWR